MSGFGIGVCRVATRNFSQGLNRSLSLSRGLRVIFVFHPAMPRRLASQVHFTTARLLQSNMLAAPPVWYDAVMMYPPIPLAPREPVQRSRYHREKDLDTKTGMGFLDD